MVGMDRNLINNEASESGETKAIAQTDEELLRSMGYKQVHSSENDTKNLKKGTNKSMLQRK
jgi:membrane-bound ClpP family serine protease